MTGLSLQPIKRDYKKLMAIRGARWEAFVLIQRRDQGLHTQIFTLPGFILNSLARDEILIRTGYLSLLYLMKIHVGCSFSKWNFCVQILTSNIRVILPQKRKGKHLVLIFYLNKSIPLIYGDLKGT